MKKYIEKSLYATAVIVCGIFIAWGYTGKPVNMVHAQTAFFNSDASSCYTYGGVGEDGNNGEGAIVWTGSTVSVDLKTSAGQTSTITIPNQKLPSILQDMLFNQTEACGWYYYTGNYYPYATYSYWNGIPFAGSPSYIPKYYLNFITSINGTKGTIAVSGSPFVFPTDPNDPNSHTPNWFETLGGWDYQGLSDMGYSASTEDAVISTIDQTGKFTSQASDGTTAGSSYANISASATNCVSLLGPTGQTGGADKIVFMRGDGWNSNVSDYLAQVQDIINNGFGQIDPFKTHINQLSFYADLKKVSQSSLATSNGYYTLASKNTLVSGSSCGSPATEYIFLFDDPNLGLAWSIKGGGMVYINVPALSAAAPIPDPISYAAIHETGHALGGLADEYIFATAGNIYSRMDPDNLVGTPDVSSNCSADPWTDYSGSDGKIYGSVDATGCGYAFSPDAQQIYYRPSDKSIMNLMDYNVRKFDIISCGYVLAALDGQPITKANAKTHWAECSNMDVTGKTELPTVGPAPVVVTVGGGAMPFLNGIFSWVGNLLPASVQQVQINRGDYSFAETEQAIKQAVNNAINGNHPVIVIAHSASAFLAYAVSNLYSGDDVQFVYVDPPYNFPLAQLGSMVTLANETKNATNPQLLWTNGNAMTNFYSHDPFDFNSQGNLNSIAPNGLTNQANLDNLTNIIYADLSTASDNTNAKYFNSVSVPALSNPPSVSSVAPTTVGPGNTVTVTGSFDPNGDDIHVQGNDPSIYYDFYDVTPQNGNTTLTFDLPFSYDWSGSLNDTVPGGYTVSVSGSYSPWDYAADNTSNINIVSTPVTPPPASGNPPTNLTATMSSTNANLMNLSWQNNSSVNNVKNIMVERAFVDNTPNAVPTAFVVIATLNSGSTAYVDDISSVSIPREEIEGIIYRIRVLYNNGTYSDYLTGNKSCGSVLKSIYDKLPTTLTGTVTLPYFLSQAARTTGYISNIKDIVLHLNLPNTDTQSAISRALPLLTSPGVLSTALQGAPNLSGKWIPIGYDGYAVNVPPAFLRKMILNDLPGIVQDLGKNYNLSSDETNELFYGILFGGTSFVITDFTYVPAGILGGDIKFSYTLVKSLGSCTSSKKDSIATFVTQTLGLINASKTASPSVSSISPSNGIPNTFSVSGSSFDTVNNFIKLSPVSTVSFIPSSVLQANSSSFFSIIQKLFEYLFPKAHGQVISTTTDTTDVFYLISNVQSSGSSLMFSVPTTTPDGVYKVSISGINSDWTDTPYTITVNGNGVGDPTTEIGYVSPPNNAVPTLILSASPTSITSGQSSTITWSSTDATACSITENGNSWQTGTSGSMSSGALPQGSTVFSGSCTGTGGTSSVQTVTVYVTPILVPISGTVGPSGALSPIAATPTAYTCAQGTLNANNTCTYNSTTKTNYGAASYTKTCPSGFTPLNGVDACGYTNGSGYAAYNLAYSCPSGGTVDASTGWIFETVYIGGRTIARYYNYDCTTSTTVPVTVAATPSAYSCPTGYTIATSTCSLSIPQAPTNLTVATSSGYIVISWNDNSVANVNSIEIDRGTSSNPATLSALVSYIPTETAFISDLTAVPGTTYYYQVRMKYTNGNYSSSTNMVSAVAPGVTPSFTLSASSTAVTLGGSTNITWSSSKALTCTILKNGSAWQTGISGSISSGALTSDTTFSGSCTGAGGGISSTQTVTVKMATSISSGVATTSAGGTFTVLGTGFTSTNQAKFVVSSPAHTYTVTATSSNGTTLSVPVPNIPSASYGFSVLSSTTGSIWTSTTTVNVTSAPSVSSAPSMVFTTQSTGGSTWSCPAGYSQAPVTQPLSADVCDINTGPTSLTAAADPATRHVNLSWNNNGIPNVQNVEVLRGASPATTISNGPHVSLSPATATYSDVVLPNQGYYYQVYLKYTNGASSTLSNMVYATTSPLVAPTNLTSNASTLSTVTLSWNNNGAAGATGVSIERANSANGPYTQLGLVSSTTTSYTDTGLPFGTTYYYNARIQYGAFGYGPYAATTSVTTINPSKPVLSVTANGPYEVDLSWTDPDAGLTGFTVFSSPTATNVATLGTTTKSYVISNLQPNTQYCYYVQAVINPQTNATSTTVCATTPALRSLGTTYSLSYVAYSSNTSSVIPYIATLQPGTYTFSGSGASSHGVASPCLSAVEDESLAFLSTNPSETITTMFKGVLSYLGWVTNGIVTLPTPGYTHYNTSATDPVIYAWYIPIQGNTTTSISTATITIPTTEYVYTWNGCQTGSMSILGPYLPPTNITATSSAPTSIALSWHDSASGTTGASIERSTSQSSSFTPIGTSANGTYIDTGLTPSTSYSYRLRTTYANNIYSPYSSVISATTSNPAVTIPTLTITSNPGNVVMEWSDTDSSVTGFTLLEIYPASTTLANGDSRDTVYGFSANPNTKYCAVVVAQNMYSQATSSSACVTTQAYGGGGGGGVITPPYVPPVDEPEVINPGDGQQVPQGGHDGGPPPSAYNYKPYDTANIWNAISAWIGGLVRW